VVVLIPDTRFSIVICFYKMYIILRIQNCSTTLFASVILRHTAGAGIRNKNRAKGNGKFGPNIKTTKQFFRFNTYLLIHTFIKSVQVYSSSPNYHRSMRGFSVHLPIRCAPTGHYTALLLF